MHMQTRRNFLKYVSIVGITSFFGIRLMADEPIFIEEIGSTHMDESFDPDNWL